MTPALWSLLAVALWLIGMGTALVAISRLEGPAQAARLGLVAVASSILTLAVISLGRAGRHADEAAPVEEVTP